MVHGNMILGGNVVQRAPPPPPPPASTTIEVPSTEKQTIQKATKANTDRAVEVLSNLGRCTTDQLHDVRQILIISWWMSKTKVKKYKELIQRMIGIDVWRRWQEK